MDGRTVWTPQPGSCFESGGRAASTNKRQSRDGYSGLLDQSTEPAPSRDRRGLWREERLKAIREGRQRRCGKESISGARDGGKTVFPPIRRGNTAGMG